MNMFPTTTRPDGGELPEVQTWSRELWTVEINVNGHWHQMKFTDEKQTEIEAIQRADVYWQNGWLPRVRHVLHIEVITQETVLTYNEPPSELVKNRDHGLFIGG
jgi:hypothetical protein